MSLLDAQNLIEIKLHYKFVDVKGTKKLVIYDEDKVEEIMKTPETSLGVEILTTQWSNLSWREQNEVMELASRATGPRGEKQFDFITYRDAIIKRCLKKWDIKMNEKPVPVTPDAIDNLPGSVVVELYQRFDAILNYTEEELKN